jgi:uncharacterized membrane protein
MKTKRALFFIFIFTISLLIPFGVIKAKDYSIPQVNIDVTINKDGSANFIEKRTFKLDGSFTFGYYDLPKSGYGRIESFAVYESGKDGKETKLSQEVEENSVNYRVKYFYNANNEEKTFIYRYKLSGLIKAYKDYGEFYWKLQGSGWDKKIGKFESKIKFLTPIDKDAYLVWAHGPLWGEITKIDEQTVGLTVKNVPPNTFIEIRILIPINYFENVEIIDASIKNNAISEEKNWALKANAERTAARIALYIPLAGFIAFLIILWFFYKKYGAEYKRPKNYVYYREIPSDIPPAVLGYLINFGDIRTEYIVATLMDLIHRKFMDIETIDEKKKRYLLNRLPNNEQLNEYEEILLNKIIFDKSQSTEISELNKKFNKSPSHYAKLFEDFEEKIGEKSKEYDFFDQVSAGKGNLITGFSIFIGILSLVLGGLFKNPAFYSWIMLVPIYIIVGTKAIPRRSVKGKEEYDKWMAFKRYLSDFSNLKEYGPKSVVIWEEYLIYGIILGVSRNVIKALKLYLPVLGDLNNGTFIYFASRSSLSNFDRAFYSLNSSLTSSAVILSSTYATSKSHSSSWSGSGGGFSGGGGGGGGGSGGGMG